MMARILKLVRRPRNLAAGVVVLGVLAAGAFAAARRAAVPDLPTALVTKGAVRRHARDPR